MVIQGFPGSSAGKESACKAGDPGSILGSRRSPGGGHGNQLQYSCLENPHGQRSLVGYSPWCHKQSDMTEQPTYTHSSRKSYSFLRGGWGIYFPPQRQKQNFYSVIMKTISLFLISNTIFQFKKIRYSLGN